MFWAQLLRCLPRRARPRRPTPAYKLRRECNSPCRLTGVRTSRAAMAGQGWAADTGKGQIWSRIGGTEGTLDAEVGGRGQTRFAPGSCNRGRPLPNAPFRRPRPAAGNRWSCSAQATTWVSATKGRQALPGSRCWIQVHCWSCSSRRPANNESASPPHDCLPSTLVTRPRSQTCCVQEATAGKRERPNPNSQHRRQHSGSCNAGRQLLRQSRVRLDQQSS